MNIRIIFCLAALAIATNCPQASAQTYTLGFDQTEYNIEPGATVEVKLLLTEVAANGETLRLAPGGNDGLFAFGAGVDYSAFTGGAGSTFESLIFNSDFLQSDPDFTKINDDGSVVSFETSETTGAGVSGVEVFADTYELELATLTFNAGGAGSATTLQLRTGQAPITNPFVFADSFSPVIDFGSSQIIVNAVPEPGSAAILILVASAGLMRRRRN